ncbi:MAG: phosphoribosyltransferase family protein [Eubacteriales bacterium]|nr:phosphoribosyltransferase family protein [Eubacteriales bacterium]
MPEFYKINIAGVERELERFPVSDTLDIAAFILFNDVEITEKSSEALLKICPEFDVIFTAEAKSIPLAYEMARQSGKEYIIARKKLKVYMKNSIGVEVKSITTPEIQSLYLGEDAVNTLKGKRVLIVDDVISTGASLDAMVELAEKAGGNIVGKAAILAEGDAAKRDDIIFLEPLPLFFK